MSMDRHGFLLTTESRILFFVCSVSSVVEDGGKVRGASVMSKLGNRIQLVSGQHIEAANTNSVGSGVAYLTGPTDFVEKKTFATKYTEYPKVCCDKNDILITVKGSGTGSIAVASASSWMIHCRLKLYPFLLAII